MIATNKGMGRLLFYYIKYLIFELLVGRNTKITVEKKNKTLPGSPSGINGQDIS
jgi:hypothetical protein